MQLERAAATGHEGVVKPLLDRNNVDPNRPNARALTPLGCSACWCHKATAELLLLWDDVDPNCPAKHDQTPLGWAAGKGSEGVVDLLPR